MIFGTSGSDVSHPSRSGDGVTLLGGIRTATPFDSKNALVTRGRAVTAPRTSTALPPWMNGHRMTRTAQNTL
ncbi:hypothetical protein ACVW19_000955 [Streptomyces sp. TE5632]